MIFNDTIVLAAGAGGGEQNDATVRDPSGAAVIPAGGVRAVLRHQPSRGGARGGHRHRQSQTRTTLGDSES